MGANKNAKFRKALKALCDKHNAVLWAGTGSSLVIATAPKGNTMPLTCVYADAGWIGAYDPYAVPAGKKGRKS